jgi:hypothetical protein
MEPHPIRLVVADDLVRSRLTVFFRLLLAIPHFIWIALWSIAVLLVVVVSWFVALFAGRVPEGLHAFMAAYVRYHTHLSAYLFLTANPYPGFTGRPGSYPIDLEIDGPARQSRWKVAFRLVLLIPAALLTGVLTGAGGGSGGVASSQQQAGSDTSVNIGSTGSVLVVVAILGWFVCLALARMPLGFRDLGAYGLRYSGQTLAYGLLLTDRYPNADPALPAATQPTPAKPIRLAVEGELARSRLTVFFRLLLAFPHFVWLALWGVVVLFALLAGWIAALVTGRLPDALHRFIAAYVRYSIHVTAFLALVGNPFPGFAGAAGSYPIDVAIDPPARQSRAKTFFRLFLVLPALAVSGALAGPLYLVAVFGWFVSLFLGRMPESLRNLGAFVLRYDAQAYGYLFLLTDSYPFAGPAEYLEPEPESEPGLGWPEAPPSPSF